MPPFRRTMENDNVRGGYRVVRGRGRGRGRGGGRRLRRLAPLAIPELPNEAVRGRGRIGIGPRRWTVHGGPVVSPPRIFHPYHMFHPDDSSDEDMAPEQNREDPVANPLVDPLALPEVLLDVPHSPEGSSSESGIHLPNVTLMLGPISSPSISPFNSAASSTSSYSLDSEQMGTSSLSSNISTSSTSSSSLDILPMFDSSDDDI